MWRMNASSPSSLGRITDSSRHKISHYGCGGIQAPVSAQKLANALWEMSSSPGVEFEQLQGKIAIRENNGDCKMRRSIERSKESMFNSHSTIISKIMKKQGHEGLSSDASDCLSSWSLMETEFHSESFIPRKSILLTKEHLNDLRNALLTSKELLKILFRFWEPTEQHNLVLTVFTALRAELERAIVNGDQLFKEQRSICSKINSVKEQLTFEIEFLKNKEQKRTFSSILAITKELQSEKKQRRRVERLNKKLAMELAETRTSLLRAGRELASDRRSRKIVEHVCDGLIKGIGEENAQVKELIRMSAKVLDDLEKEKKMLHLADEWREERVHMKLSEAALQFEEKNATVDQLRTKLETFLNTEKGTGELVVKEQSIVRPSKADERVDNEEKGSAGALSDYCNLHSIDLNMDSKSRSFNWSYATGSADYGRGFEENIEGSKKQNKASISNGNENEENTRNGCQISSLDWPHKRILMSNATIDEDEDAKRYISVKELRDHLLTGSRNILPQCMRSPSRQWSTSTSPKWDWLKDFHDSEESLYERFKVAELVKQLERRDGK